MKKTFRVFGFLLFIAGYFLLPAITLAKTNEDPGPEFNSGQWIWALLSLVIVVVLAYWATRFLAGKFGVSQTGHLKVAESLFLGPNRHLYLLLVNGKVLLLGSTEHGLSLLKEFDDLQFYEELKKTAATNQVIPAGGFADLLNPLIKGMNPRGTIEAGFASSKQRMQDGLEKIRSWKDRGRGQ